MNDLPAESVCRSILRSVFSVGEYFSQTRENDLNELHEGILCKAISLNSVVLPATPEDFASDKAWRGAYFTGREAHQELCCRAALWIEAQGKAWRGGSTLHYPGDIGIADVLSVDRTIAVEAGYTRALKVFDALMYGMSVLVVPHDQGEPVLGFLFGRGSHAEDFFEKMQEKRAEESMRIAKEMLDGIL